MMSLIIPYHLDHQRLILSIKRIEEYSSKKLISEVLFCHNGSGNSGDLNAFIPLNTKINYRFLHTDTKGMGAGYKIGIKNASAKFLVLTASDLPFGFTDIDAFLDRMNRGKVSDITIGSKGHISSQLQDYSCLRRFCSICFYFLRYIILGRYTPYDSQGSIIIKREVANNLFNLLEADNYFISLEIISLAIQKGYEVKEVPILLDSFNNESSVRIFRDSLLMLRQLIQLKIKLLKIN